MDNDKLPLLGSLPTVLGLLAEILMIDVALGVKRFDVDILGAGPCRYPVTISYSFPFPETGPGHLSNCVVAAAISVAGCLNGQMVKQNRWWFASWRVY
jgi:hypothetical protein